MLFRQSVKEELKVPADMQYLGQLRDFVIRIGRKYGFDDKVISSLKLATDEAATNIIRHSYRDLPSGKKGMITMRAIIKTNSLVIVLIDQGKTFDPRNAKAPNMKEYVKIGKKGGLGIFMLQKLMDEIDYHVTTEGNELRLTKYRKHTKETTTSRLKQINLKHRYAIISSAALTLLVLTGYYFFQNIQTNRMVTEILKRVTAISATMSSTGSEYLARYDDLTVFQIAQTLKKENDRFISNIIITDSTGRIFASSDRSSLGLLVLPEEYEDLSGMNGAGSPVVEDSVLEQLENPLLLSQVQIKKFSYQDQIVYCVTTPIYLGNAIREGNLLGYAHVMALETAILDELLGLKILGIVLSLLVLLIGYGGIAILVARIISPFQKLTDWIRSAGHETVTDDVDIDTSNEVGEIAQAFTDMAAKFRKAQISLVQQKQLQKEIQVAQEIQHMLLPSTFPDVDGYDISTFYESAKEVGGDLFDFVRVDDHTIGISVADVSGKGVPGSLVMTMIRTALRLEARENKDPADVLARVNEFVMDDMKKGMFVTTYYIVLDSRNREIHYASAGHNPMILHRASTKQTYYLNPPGFPVGIALADRELFRKTIKTDSIKLKEDDILIAYTDGITEAMNPSRELFGEERFLESIRRHAHLDARQFVENLKDDIQRFTQGAPQNDDITLVAIKENLVASEVLFNLRKTLIDDVAAGMSIKEACEKAGVSTSTYYKYKKRYQEMGIEGLRIKSDFTNIEAKQMSIEQRAKIIAIIQSNPEHGPKMISNLLNTEKYGFTSISEKRIYDELIRLRLNTQEKRMAFVTGLSKSRRHFKIPGTPLVTMEGEVIKTDSRQTESAVDAILKARSASQDETVAVDTRISSQTEQAD